MSSRSSTSLGAKFVGAVLVLGLVLLILKWALITAAILIVPFGVWWAWDQTRDQRATRRAEAQQMTDRRRRDEIESRASVDAAGGCGWCGSRIAHRDDRGTLVFPVDFHRAEIEEQLRSASASR
ncbi:hypothetical protein EV383_5704 [Pseudonocardia sediminis]|uniref:Uncharacterized protein n=2 Tax=Pseudonocardia sediminis TaxID=1397368 RepID=A0A4Q7V7M2_PSEST|nr:hypothetical protein EV383_5704 [Pseudonocardia sediminis]